MLPYNFSIIIFIFRYFLIHPQQFLWAFFLSLSQHYPLFCIRKKFKSDQDKKLFVQFTAQTNFQLNSNLPKWMRVKFFADALDFSWLLISRIIKVSVNVSAKIILDIKTYIYPYNHCLLLTESRVTGNAKRMRPLSNWSFPEISKS